MASDAALLNEILTLPAAPLVLVQQEKVQFTCAAAAFHHSRSCEGQMAHYLRLSRDLSGFDDLPYADLLLRAANTARRSRGLALQYLSGLVEVTVTCDEDVEPLLELARVEDCKRTQIRLAPCAPGVDPVLYARFKCNVTKLAEGCNIRVIVPEPRAPFRHSVWWPDGRRIPRRRREDLLQIRKKREIMKNRRVSPYQMMLDLESIPSIVQGARSDDPTMQLEATTYFRKLLSVERSPPIDDVIQAGVVPRFVQFLGREDIPQLQFEAAWALTNVASGTSDHTRVVIEQGAVPLFLQLLGSGSDDVREQAVWALGNIAGDSPTCRDLVLAQNALMPLLAQFNENSSLSMLRKATWTLSNFCRGKPPSPFDQVKPALPILLPLIYSNDEEVLTHACWALSYLSDGPNENIKAVIDAGFCKRLVELLLVSHQSPTVLIPALRTVGNIVAAADDTQSQFVIDNQVLPFLYNLLTQDLKNIIKKEACWTISNITAGNKAQIQAVLDAKLIKHLVLLLQYKDFDIKKEAAMALSNAISGGSLEQIQFMAAQGCIKPLCDLLVCPDPRIVIVCLEGLENILMVGEACKDMGMNEGINLYAQQVKDSGGLETIETLTKHDDNEIKQIAASIIRSRWDVEMDTEPDYRIHLYF